ncbi:MAG: MBOAT family O-acyltransferase [Polymorphobacter sp.]
MLFNSPEFLFGFLPVTFAGFFLIARRNHAAAAAWLGAASLFFYGWWSLSALPLLLGSILFNYWMGLLVSPRAGSSDARRKLLLIFALVVDLGILATFKYADFFIANADAVLGAAGLPQLGLLGIVLPIGISFYTFTQIAFLVDCYQGKVVERRFVHYLLFVTYFPHLISGPVLHHAQMMPQFRERRTYRMDPAKIYLGISIFGIGLAKKIVLADSLADFVNPFFDLAHAGATISFIDGWMGALAYTLQLYFDFSGYTDMAIGLSLLFGVTLPINFDSPYKATSIIDFWRRWHITLSNFLRDYLYIPLGGNRNGDFRRHANLLTTMLLGGLWHGANWTFVLWGGAHGTMLVINHLWRQLLGANVPTGRFAGFARFAGWGLTFIAVVLAWVLFRAESVATAGAIYRGMFAVNGFVLPAQVAAILPFGGWFASVGTMPTLGGGSVRGVFEQATLLLVGLAVALFGRQARHMSNAMRLLVIGISAGFVVHGLFFAAPKEFMYFQF